MIPIILIGIMVLVGIVLALSAVFSMASENQQCNRVSNPEAEDDEWMGEDTITIADSATSGTVDIVFGNKFESAPKALLAVLLTNSLYSNTNYVSALTITAISTTGMTVRADIDTAPGSTHTATLTVYYKLIGKSYD